MFCTTLVLLLPLLGSINYRCADSSIMYTYRVATDNTGTKGSRETGYVVFHGIFLRFIRFFLDKRLYSDINNRIFYGVGGMDNSLVKLRDVSEGRLFTRHTNKVLVLMKTWTHSTSVYDAKCCLRNCVWNIHKTETLNYAAAKWRGRLVVGFSVWQWNRKFQTPPPKNMCIYIFVWGSN